MRANHTDGVSLKEGRGLDLTEGAPKSALRRTQEGKARQGKEYTVRRCHIGTMQQNNKATGVDLFQAGGGQLLSMLPVVQCHPGGTL